MKKDWSQFESDAVSSLNVILKGTAERKMEAMSKIIYTMGYDRFGPVKKNKAPPQPQQNQRAQKIAKIRSEIRQLTKRYKEANVTEKEALAELRDDCKLKLKRLRQAECNRKQRKKRNQKRSEFIRNPFKFTKKLLNDKTSGDLVISKEEIEKHIKKIHSDPERHIPLPDQGKLIKPDLPTIQFDETPLKMTEVRAVVKKARAGSAPGPNGIPYKVYKMCDGLLRILWQILKVHWCKRRLARCNMSSEGIFIPKEEYSKTKEQFRTVSLLNVEIKIPLAVLSHRITNFWIKNKFIDTAIQKGGIPGVSGCIEHTSVLTRGPTGLGLGRVPSVPMSSGARPPSSRITRAGYAVIKLIKTSMLSSLQRKFESLKELLPLYKLQLTIILYFFCSISRSNMDSDACRIKFSSIHHSGTIKHT